MSKLPVFISHSTDKTNADDVDRLARIVAQLGDGSDGFDVLWDKGEISGADDWWLRIHGMLAECQAAIILLSNRAINTSDWVHKESMILCHRRALDPGFRLLPVIMPGADGAPLNAGRWKPLRFDTIQHEWVDGQDIAGLVARARKDIDPAVSTRTPFDDLVTAIAAQLAFAPIDGLKHASKRHLERADWIGAPSVQQGFARGLARRLLRERNLAKAMDVLDDVFAIEADDVMAIYEMLSPLWVDPAAAAPLATGALAGETSRDFALNGEYLGEFTAESYVRRAHPLTSRARYEVVTPTNKGDLVEHIRTTLRGIARESSPALRSAAEGIVDKQLERNGRDWFVFVPSLLTATELTKLRIWYPTMTFIYDAGRGRPDDRLPAGVRFLEPALESANETAAYDAWIEAEMNVDNRRPKNPAKHGGG